MDTFSDAEIQQAITDVDHGKFNKSDLIICTRPDLLDLSHLKQHTTVTDVSAYVDSISAATAQCDLRAFQLGMCNTTAPNYLRRPNGFTVESIATELMRRMLNLDAIWCSPYQLTEKKRSSYVTIEGVTVTAERDEYLVRLPVAEVCNLPGFFEPAIRGSFLRHALVLAAAKSDKLRFDLYCSFALCFHAFLNADERREMVAPIVSGAYTAEMDLLMSYPGKDAVNAFLSFCSQDNTLNSGEKCKYTQVARVLDHGELDTLDLQNSYTSVLASLLKTGVVRPDELSRDSIGFALLAMDNGFLDDASAKLQNELDDIAFAVCSDSSLEVVHRMSQECRFRGRRRAPNGEHRYLDNRRAAYSIEPPVRPSVTTTCNGLVVRVGIADGVPWMYGLDLGTLLALVRWGVEHAPFVANGNPREDMVGDRKVHGQTVMSLLFGGHIGDRDTAWLLSQVVHGDLTIARESRNGLAHALAKYKGVAYGEGGYRINSIASHRMISRMNMVVLNGDPMLILGEYLVGRLERRRGYFRVAELEEPSRNARINAIGRADVRRPLR